MALLLLPGIAGGAGAGARRGFRAATLPERPAPAEGGERGATGAEMGQDIGTVPCGDSDALSTRDPLDRIPRCGSCWRRPTPGDMSREAQPPRTRPRIFSLTGPCQLASGCR